MSNVEAMTCEVVSYLNENKYVVYADCNSNDVLINETVEKMGIKLSEDKLDTAVYGLVRTGQKNNDEFEIVIRKGLTKEEKKMTVAHELGHALLHLPASEDNEYKDSVFYRKDLLTYTTEEREANAFAEELIMPKGKFIQFIRKNTWNNRIDLTCVAAEFGVSISAAYSRAQDLNLLE